MVTSLQSIQPFIEHLRDALWLSPNRGLASVMVGSGFSRNADPSAANARDFPLWNELAQKMATGIGLNIEQRPQDPLRIASMYAATLGSSELHRLIENEIPDREWVPGDLHHRLLSLPWADVFTTNYDTLLERACDGVHDRRYERILTPADLPMKLGPRLVKLHGTLKSGGQLIATEEDYRTYPEKYSSFVNFVRQSIMETVFVLIGFAGDDPNFLEWAGWVRDVLGDRAPKIYLCGLLDSSPSIQALLASRRVIPIDLSRIFPDDGTDDRHHRAMDWLFSALEIGRPGRPERWAPLVNISATNVPELPPARMFTPFNERPSLTSTQETIAPQELENAAVIWRKQREEYPGWHIPPNDVRERLYEATEPWREYFFDSIDKLPLNRRLIVASEFCWRIDLCLSPIFTDETNKLVALLESVNPFGELLNIPGSYPCLDENASDLKRSWKSLAILILRTAREDLDEDRFLVWTERLRAIAGRDRSLLGDLSYENALLKLNKLDFGALRNELKKWHDEATQPLEMLRIAALYSELSDNGVALNLAMIALNMVRAGTRGPAALSLEAWCLLFVDMLHWRDPEKREKWKDRIDFTKSEGCDPWITIDHIKNNLKNARRNQGTTERIKPGFDPGDVRTTTYLGSDSQGIMSAYQLLRLSERAPCPIFAGELSLLGDSSAKAAAWLVELAPSWSLSTLLRAGTNEDTLNEIFDRATIALLDKSKATQLFNQLIHSVNKEIESITSEHGWNSFSTRIIKTGLDIISRISLRLKEEDLKLLINQAIAWLQTKPIMDHWELPQKIGIVIKRAIGALSPESLSSLVGPLISTPMFGEVTCMPRAEEKKWPEPFDELGRKTIKGESQAIENWSSEWLRIINALNQSNPDLRSRGLIRAYFLLKNDWLNEVEKLELGNAVWSHVDPDNKLPHLGHFRPLVCLELPLMAENDAQKKLKWHLLDTSLAKATGDDGSIFPIYVVEGARWMREITDVFSPPALIKTGKSNLTLSTEEAEKIALKALDWWDDLSPKILRSRKMAYFFSRDFDYSIKMFCRFLGRNILWSLATNQPLLDRIDLHLKAINDNGYPILEALPGWMHAKPETIAKSITVFEKALVSDDPTEVQSATSALLFWIVAASNSAIPEAPAKLIDLSLSRFVMLRTSGLSSVIHFLVELLKLDNSFLTPERENLLALTLEGLSESTSAEELRGRLAKSQIDRADVLNWLHIRSWSALLATTIASIKNSKGEEIPMPLQTWLSICKNDPLPEVRMM